MEQYEYRKSDQILNNIQKKMEVLLPEAGMIEKKK
jgi:hypothetical protein